jgi:hypothetical protein
MSDENNTQPGADAQQPAAQPDNAGIQKRIDELSASLHQKDETISKLTELVQQSVMQRMETKPAEEDPLAQFQKLIPENASDETRASMTTMLGQFAKLVDTKFQQVQKQVAISNVGSEVASIAQQYGVSEAVAKRTQELLAQWREQGQPFNAHDAVRFAAGEMALNTKVDPRAAQQVPVFRAANPVPQTQVAPQNQPLNESFYDLSLEEQWQILHKRVGDKPI